MIMTMLLTLLAACQRRPLYHIEELGVKVIVKVLWKVEVYPEGVKPSGVTFYFFRDGKFFRSETTADVDSCAVQLEPGHYRLYMISQSPEEFGQLEFLDMSFWDKAHASVTEAQSKWYTRAEDEILIGNPELMVAGVSEEFEVTEAMVEEYQQYKYSLLMRERALEGSKSGPESDPELAHAQYMLNYYTIRVPV